MKTKKPSMAKLAVKGAKNAAKNVRKVTKIQKLNKKVKTNNKTGKVTIGKTPGRILNKKKY